MRGGERITLPLIVTSIYAVAISLMNSKHASVEPSFKDRSTIIKLM